MATCALAVLATGAYLLLAHTPVGMFLIVFKQNPGRFDRKSLDGLAERVRLMGLMPGEQKEFRVDTLSDANSIRPLKPGTIVARGQGIGHMWAEVSRDGKLKVVVETRDLGHAGEYGFAYSDVPLLPEPFGTGGAWFSIDVPGRLNLVQPSMKVDDHWWKVEYNLD